jgi:hypothetical protein
MLTPARARPGVVRANVAASLLVAAGGATAAAYDARLGMLSAAALLGWSQLVGL